MKFTFHINSQIEFMDDPKNFINNPFHLPPNEINGKRFDTFVAYESGRVFLNALLNACKGNKTKNIPLIIQPHGLPPFCTNATFFPKKFNHHDNVKTIQIIFE